VSTVAAQIHAVSVAAAVRTVGQSVRTAPS
jgi:hypothetical protein